MTESIPEDAWPGAVNVRSEAEAERVAAAMGALVEARLREGEDAELAGTGLGELFAERLRFVLEPSYEGWAEMVRRYDADADTGTMKKRSFRNRVPQTRRLPIVDREVAVMRIDSIRAQRVEMTPGTTMIAGGSPNLYPRAPEDRRVPAMRVLFAMDFSPAGEPRPTLVAFDSWYDEAAGRWVPSRIAYHYRNIDDPVAMPLF